VPAVPVDGDALVMLGVTGTARTVTDVFADAAPSVAVMVAVPAVAPVLARPCDPPAFPIRYDGKIRRTPRDGRGDIVRAAIGECAGRSELLR
jgi:hypothetical protein